jgi:hypothetical protein
MTIFTNFPCNYNTLDYSSWCWWKREDFQNQIVCPLHAGRTDHGEHLCEAVERAARGLIDADLSGGLIKQRVARPGRGRSGGFRVLLAFRPKERAVFVFGFAKNERENINDKELAVVREVAASWLAADAKNIEKALAEGLLIKVQNEN